MRTVVQVLLASCALALSGCGAGGPTGAPPSPVHATAAPGRCTIGTPVEYRLVVSGLRADEAKIELPQKGAKFSAPPARDAREQPAASGGAPARKDAAQLPLCVVREAAYVKDANDAGKKVAVITLAFLRTGSFELPEITVTGADGVRVGYALPRITVDPVNPSKEFQEIVPPREFGGYRARMYLLALLALALIAAGAFAWRRYRHAIPVYDAEVVPVAPLDGFLEALAALKAERLEERGMNKELAAKILHALRTFAGAQCGIDATEMTGSELFTALGKGLLDRPDMDRLAECLGLWDLSRFAEFKAPAGALARSLDCAESVARAIAGRRRDERV